MHPERRLMIGRLDRRARLTAVEADCAEVDGRGGHLEDAVRVDRRSVVGGVRAGGAHGELLNETGPPIGGEFEFVGSDGQNEGPFPNAVPLRVVHRIALTAPPVESSVNVGRVARHILFVQVDANRFIEHERILLSPPDFEPLNLTLGAFKPTTTWVRPKQFEALCHAAQDLSRPFDFVRVDLYEKAGQVFFGEFTFTPGAGMEPFSEPGFSRRLLSEIKARPDCPAR